MKMTTRFLMPVVVCLVLLMLCSCEKEVAVDKTKAVGSVIDIRIGANDFDGAMEVLANCDETAFEQGELEEYRLRIVESAKEFVSAKVDEIIEQSGYKEAYEYLENSLPGVLAGDSLAEEKSRIRALMVDDIFVLAQACAQEGNYAEAIAMLSGINDSDSDEKTTETIENYKQLYADDTLAAVNSGTLGEQKCIELLEQTYDVTENADIAEKLKQLSRPRHLQALGSVKHRFELMHDDTTNAYTLKSKLFNTFVKNAATSRGGMVSSALSECNGAVTFFLVLAYSTDELLETKEMIFNCDGAVYSFAIEDGQREEKVIDLDNDLEICGIFDSPASERHTLTRLMEVLSKASSVTVTAKGTNRDMDFEVPVGHIREMLMVWEAYNVFRENPELFTEVFVEKAA